jgi:hypothetical protein
MNRSSSLFVVPAIGMFTSQNLRLGMGQEESAQNRRNRISFGLSVCAVAVKLISCSHQENETTKAKTLSAWKAMQKAEHDNAFQGSQASLDEPSTLMPCIKFFQDLAFSYSQIDLYGVDEMLVNHLKVATEVFATNAQAEQGAYNDIAAAIKSRQEDTATSQQIGNWLADEDHKQTAAAFAGWLYTLSTDDSFQSQLKQIQAKHRPELDSGSEKLNAMFEDRAVVAKTLTDKYHVEFINL